MLALVFLFWWWCVEDDLLCSSRRRVSYHNPHLNPHTDAHAKGDGWCSKPRRKANVTDTLSKRLIDMYYAFCRCCFREKAMFAYWAVVLERSLICFDNDTAWSQHSLFRVNSPLLNATSLYNIDEENHITLSGTNSNTRKKRCSRVRSWSNRVSCSWPPSPCFCLPFLTIPRGARVDRKQ